MIASHNGNGNCYITTKQDRIPERDLITISVPEVLAFFLLIVCLFLFFFSSVFESKRLKNAGVTSVADAFSAEAKDNKSKVDSNLIFHGLEDIEAEESAESHQRKKTPHNHNPILLLANIES